MKKKAAVIMAVMAGMLAMTACEQKTTVVKSEKAKTTETANTENTSAKNEKADAELSADIYAFQVSIDGKILQFPMTYQNFMETGWEYTGDEEAGIPAGSGMLSDWFKKGDDMMLGYITNFDTRSETVLNSYITGILITDDYIQDEEREILLPGKIALGTSTQDEVLKAYGDPQDSIESDTFPTMTYEPGENQYVTLTFNRAKDSILSEILIRNEIVPDDFKTSKQDEETAPKGKAYKAPEVLSNHLFDYTVSFHGALYQLPAPVSEFVANGWELIEDESEMVIESQKTGRVTLTKGDQTFWADVMNDSDQTEEVLNCVVTNLAANVKGCDVEMGISGGVHMGMTQERLEEAIKQYDYKKEVNSYTYYEIADPDREDCGYEVIVKDGIVTGIEIMT
ncbi:MAG: hypothetical protein PHW34_14740 [Hespellia sp.]|nr:hypothetical protein [Hespellia sp.]